MLSSPIPPAGHIPTQFLQTLVELEDAVNKTIASEKSAAKKMAPIKAKALNGMKQTLKKKGKEFEGVLKVYNEDPAAYAANYDAANTAPTVVKPVKRAVDRTDEGAGDDEFMTIGKGGKALNLTPEGVFKTLKDIFEQRGRKVCPEPGSGANGRTRTERKPFGSYKNCLRLRPPHISAFECTSH